MEQGLSLEGYLDQHHHLVYDFVGVSMLPLLRQGRDLVVIEKKAADRFQVGDVVLYRRSPHRYVLHRVIEVREKDYVILGDNCISLELGITDEDILGVMTGYVRSGKQHSVTERGYRLYTFWMVHCWRIRVFYRMTVRRIKDAIKKVLYVFGWRRTKA